MKILEFIRVFNEATATFIYNELTELVQLGHDVKVTCVERLNEKQYPFPGVEVLPLTPWQRKLNYGLSRYGLRYNFSNRAFRERFRDVVHAFGPDAIHCQFGLDALFVLDNFADPDIPVLISFHGYDASSLLLKRGYRQRLNEAFRRREVFPVFVSHFMRDNFRRKGVTFGDSFILYYGTDASFFKRRSPPGPKAPFRFLQVSSFREKKGHEYTLQAFARLGQAHPGCNVRLVLAGDGPLLNNMKTLARNLGLEDSVDFPGLVNPEEARTLMGQAHAFVHHSVTARRTGDMEGIPNAIMEAMAMELPVITTLHSGIPELVEDGVHGFLVAERDIDTYADRMAAILDWDLQPGNREKVLAQFDRKKHARQLITYLEEAIEKLSH